MYTIDGKFNDLNPDLIGVNNVSNSFINKPVEDRFPKNKYPKGMVLGNGMEVNNYTIKSLRKAAEVHKQVRMYIQPFLKPGVDLLEVANELEGKVRELLKNQGLNGGNGFPTGLSLDNCAAHWTPHYKQSKKLRKDSVLKIDFGVHVNEWIIDSAFTIAFEPKYKTLLDAVKEATWTGIKNAKIDMPINEWGGLIREVMESYEVELNGKNYPVKVIKNLFGHNILKGRIHGGKFLPAFNYEAINDRFKEGVYAVETFGCIKGNGWVENDHTDNSHYTLNSQGYYNSPLKKVNTVYNHIQKRFDTLPFCDRWIDDHIYSNLGSSSKSSLNVLSKNRIVQEYPPLYDKKGSKTAQYEHTIYISDGRTEVLSAGNDY